MEGRLFGLRSDRVCNAWGEILSVKKTLEILFSDRSGNPF